MTAEKEETERTDETDRDKHYYCIAHQLGYCIQKPPRDDDWGKSAISKQN
ncbi:hypothetical protein MY4038_004452 [Beauveria bassiana]